ncbi:MAG: hypothetical protein K2K57_09880 [Oscillospiraceae bacterium]|nr:hypothetical protein [Oscillospiraceae bacterium]
MPETTKTPRFHLPEATSSISLYLALPDYMKNHPEFFRGEIASYFGSWPLIWNGGRNMFGPLSLERVKNQLDAYNSRGVPYRFTFTNPLITEEHLDDKECNEVLKIADNGVNEVIVVSPVLEEYIRQTHPRMKITSSTCKCIRDIEGVKEELKKDYSLVVLDYNFNNKTEELEKLTPEERARCEILSNAVCIPACPRRRKHYEQIGEMQLGLTKKSRFESLDKEWYKKNNCEWDCPTQQIHLYDNTDSPLRLMPEDIYGKYSEMGFINFKLEGRGEFFVTLCEQAVNYLARPEYRDKARLEIMTAAVKYIGLNY